jgi:hypothetical protein
VFRRGGRSKRLTVADEIIVSSPAVHGSSFLPVADFRKARFLQQSLRRFGPKSVRGVCHGKEELGQPAEDHQEG